MASPGATDSDRKCLFFTCGETKILQKNKNNPIIMSVIVAHSESVIFQSLSNQTVLNRSYRSGN